MKKDLKVSNDFVHSIIKKNNHLTLKLLFLMVYRGVIEKGTNLSSIAIDIRDIKKEINLDFNHIRQNIKQIQKTLITIQDNKKVIDLVLIPKASYEYDKQLIKIDIYNEVLNELQQLQNKYTIINLDNLLKLNNKHSIRLLTILESINRYDSFIAKTKEYTNEELNELFDTNYKGFREIERAILKPIQAELDELSNLTFIYDVLYDIDTNKVGRKPITGIKIYLKENKQRQLTMF